MSRGTTQPKPRLVDSRPRKAHRPSQAEAYAKPQLPPDTMSYIAALCAELSAMARMGGCTDLAYFLEMARMEAATILLRQEEQPLTPALKG